MTLCIDVLFEEDVGVESPMRLRIPGPVSVSQSPLMNQVRSTGDRAAPTSLAGVA